MYISSPCYKCLNKIVNKTFNCHMFCKKYEDYKDTINKESMERKKAVKYDKDINMYRFTQNEIIRKTKRIKKKG